MRKRTVAYTGGLLVLMLSVAASTLGVAAGLLSTVAVACVVLLICVGPERLGLIFVGLAFLTAPFFSGFVPLAGVATPPDAFLALSAVVLLPRLLTGRNHLAPPFVIGIIALLLTGVIGSVTSPAPALSLIGLAQMLICVAGIPIFVASLNLDRVAVERFSWTFVAGHVLSTLFALASGPVGDGGRYDGLTSHPNAFGQSGMLSFALLLHLLHTTKRKWLVWAAMAICLGSVFISGSRGNTLTVACLVLVIPIVERSAFVGYLLALAGFAAGLALQYVLAPGATGDSVSRLVGGGSAGASDEVRKKTLAQGFDRFLEHPLRGNGFLDLFSIHNNYVEVAVAAGIIGAVGYVLAVWALTRSLFGTSPLRRLGYPALAYAITAMTVPSLNDRSIWMSIALGFALFRGYSDLPTEPARRTPDDLSRPSAPVDSRPAPRGTLR